MRTQVHGFNSNLSSIMLLGLEYDINKGVLYIEGEYGINIFKTVKLNYDNSVQIRNNANYVLYYFLKQNQNGIEIEKRRLINYEDINEIVLKSCPKYSVSNNGKILTYNDSYETSKIMFVCESALGKFDHSIDLRNDNYGFLYCICYKKCTAKLFLSHLKLITVDNVDYIQQIAKNVPEWSGTIIYASNKPIEKDGFNIKDVEKTNINIVSLIGCGDKYGNIIYLK